MLKPNYRIQIKFLCMFHFFVVYCNIWHFNYVLCFEGICGFVSTAKGVKAPVQKSAVMHAHDSRAQIPGSLCPGEGHQGWQFVPCSFWKVSHILTSAATAFCQCLNISNFAVKYLIVHNQVIIAHYCVRDFFISRHQMNIIKIIT